MIGSGDEDHESHVMLMIVESIFDEPPGPDPLSHGKRESNTQNGFGLWLLQFPGFR